MRILVVQDGDWTKKGPHNQHHLMERLSCRGHQVIVVGYDQLWGQEPGNLFSKTVALKDFHRFCEGAKIQFIRTSFLRLPLLDYLSFLVSCRREINKLSDFKPDVVVCFSSIVSGYWGLRFAEEEDIPFVYYWTDLIHCLVPEKWLAGIAKLVERRIALESSAVVATNRGLIDYLKGKGVEENHLHLIPGGVDPGRFDEMKSSPSEVRAKYGISPDEILLFYMGWLYEFSGLKEVIDAMHSPIYDTGRMKLLIVGGGDYLDELREHVRGSNMESRVIVAGQKPYSEIPGLINASDLCILPALDREIMEHIVPIKLYEYMAMKKPVISTRLGGVEKEFGNDNGIIFVDRPEEVPRIALELTRRQMSDIGQKGGALMRKYTWESITDQFEKLLERLTEENDAR